MSTYTDWVTVAEACIPADSLNKAFVLRNRIDFSVVNTTASATVQALAIPAGTFVLDVLTELITAEGSALTATLGDGSGANSWDASIDLNTTAGTVTQATVGTDAYAASTARGKVYTAADTIDLVTSAAAADTAVIDVFAICFDLNV